MKDVYITIYTKDKGKLELSKEEWQKFDSNSISLHREDGPAMEQDGVKEWWINDKRHRIDGPAVEEWHNNSKAWWIDDKQYWDWEFDQIIEEAKALPQELKLTDPRWWVRELK